MFNSTYNYVPVYNNPHFSEVDGSQQAAPSPVREDLQDNLSSLDYPVSSLFIDLKRPGDNSLITGPGYEREYVV